MRCSGKLSKTEVISGLSYVAYNDWVTWIMLKTTLDLSRPQLWRVRCCNHVCTVYTVVHCFKMATAEFYSSGGRGASLVVQAGSEDDLQGFQLQPWRADHVSSPTNSNRLLPCMVHKLAANLFHSPWSNGLILSDKIHTEWIRPVSLQANMLRSSGCLRPLGIEV